MKTLEFSNEAQAVGVVESGHSSPDAKTLAAEFLHHQANDDGRHEQLIFEALEPLLEAEHRFEQGRGVFLRAVRLVAELACRRQRWKAANNALILLGAQEDGLPAWARSYRAKTYYKLQPRAAVSRPDVVVQILQPIDELTIQGKAVLEEYVNVARQVFELDGDPDGSATAAFMAKVRELTGGIPGETKPRLIDDDTDSDDEDSHVTTALTTIEPDPAKPTLPDPAGREQELEAQLREALARISDLEAQQEAATDAQLEPAEPVDDEPIPIDRIIGKRHILVLGDIRAKAEHLVGKAKKFGLSKAHLRFETDYAKLTQFDLSQLQYSNECAGILVGAIPHKMKGLGSASSALQLFETEEGYPPAVGMRTASGELKGTKKSFDAAMGELLTTLTANTAAA